METLMSLRIELTEYEMHERQKAIQKNDNMVDESFEFVYEWIKVYDCTAELLYIYYD